MHIHLHTETLPMPFLPRHTEAHYKTMLSPQKNKRDILSSNIYGMNFTSNCGPKNTGVYVQVVDPDSPNILLHLHLFLPSQIVLCYSWKDFINFIMVESFLDPIWYFWEKRIMFLHMIHKGHILRWI